MVKRLRALEVSWQTKSYQSAKRREENIGMIHIIRHQKVRLDVDLYHVPPLEILRTRAGGGLGIGDATGCVGMSHMHEGATLTTTSL